MKKVFSLILALVMVMSLATTAFAATQTPYDDPVTVTVSHHAKDHTFTAYQIFDGNVTAEGYMSNIAWGADISDPAAMLAKLKSDTVVCENPDGAGTTLQDEFATAADAQDVAAVLANQWGNDGTRIDRFAEVVGPFLSGGKAHSVVREVKDPNDNTKVIGYEYDITDLDPGYYLIKDTTDMVTGEDFRTKYIVFLNTDTTVATKGNYTTVTKDVSVNLDSGYGDGMTRALELKYFYELKADLDNQLGWFDEYYLSFHDTMSAGIDFIQVEEIYIIDRNNSNKLYLYVDPNKPVDGDKNNLNPAWVADGTKIDVGNLVAVKQADGTTKLDLGWTDIKAAAAAAAAQAGNTNYVLEGDDQVVVKYSAKLNQNAIIGGVGNDNEVYLEFSNDYSADGHGQTEKDEEKVFSFQLEVLKVDPGKDLEDLSDNTPLQGAKFYLYVKDSKDNTIKWYCLMDSTTNKITGYTTTTPDSIIAAIKTAKESTTLTAEEIEAEVARLNAELAKYTLTSDANGLFNVQGLERTTMYYLHEAQAPAGYNLLAHDVSIFITCDISRNASNEIVYSNLAIAVDGGQPKAVSANDPDFSIGKVSAIIANEQGEKLPSTGGVGTTLFYIVGGAMVAAALVLLITKKRMADAN